VKKEFTKWFILGTLILWLVVDIVLDAKGGPTISRFIMDSLPNFGIPILFGIGYFSGHFTWGQKIKD